MIQNNSMNHARLLPFCAEKGRTSGPVSDDNLKKRYSILPSCQQSTRCDKTSDTTARVDHSAAGIPHIPEERPGGGPNPPSPNGEVTVRERSAAGTISTRYFQHVIAFRDRTLPVVEILDCET